MPDRKFAPIIFDRWTPYSYKRSIADRHSSGIDWMAPTWIGDFNRRRVQAYSFLRGYIDNVARLYSEQLTQEQRIAADRRREYGDAHLLVETARSKMMGDQQTIVVDGADEFDQDSETNDVEAVKANQRQEELRQWGEDERFGTKCTETERNSTGLGDGVYTLSWDEPTKRPRLLPWEPECYFPALGSVQNGQYPTRVHLAWELTDEEVAEKYGGNDTIVHRITYELVDVGEVGLTPYALPYEEKLAKQVCIVTEAEYKLGNGSRSVDDLDESTAIYMLDDEGLPIRNKPLMIDFIPVVHIPNTVAEIEHFGRSVLAPATQLLDDIYSVDSDIEASAALTGSPTLVFRGAKAADNETVGPGKSFSIPDPAGGVDAVSGAEGIEGLMSIRDSMLDRLAIVSRVTAAAQGRINVEKLQAGVILQLSFGPLTSLIEEMRLARKDKYRLLFKFVQRYMLINEVWEGDVLDADLAFGSYLPSDRSAMVTDVTAAYAAKLISAETAIRMLIEVGFPINDIAEELAKIDARDMDALMQLQELTGNDEEIKRRTGIEVKMPEPQDVIAGNPNNPNQPPANNSPQQ